MTSIVIVESPAKARTLEKFLGKNFRVLASYGHVRDLPKKGLGVDREHSYEPTYEVLHGKEKTLAELKRAAQKADVVYLAADPDREGEAISWHLKETLTPSAKDKPFRRVRFNEITKKAVLAAMDDAGEIDSRLVDAQQARRIIDRLVGYEVSDLLWKKIWRGLSAGRVQTVALRIICEREKEIESFVPVEYWTVDADLEAGAPPPFTAKLVSFDGQKLKFDGTDPRLESEAAASRVREEAERAPWRVVKVEASERRKNPAPPFITSQLQQAAARRLGFPVRRTMQIAQRLYEGREIPGKGTVGLITYMRTDSTRVSNDALAAVREHISARYGTGPDVLPESPRFFKGKRDVQDAHEAIRPTDLSLSPEEVAKHVGSEEAKLYRLIWERFVGSQMAPAVYDTVSAEIEAGRAVYRASGSTLKTPGYLVVYGVSAEEEDDAEKDTAGTKLPPLTAGETLKLVALKPEKKATQPPPRYNEASLVKFLEENGIGRPSTYAEILRKIEDREYVRKKDRRFLPTALGRTVVELLIPYFDDFFETGYTAEMEQRLDDVEEGKVSWRDVLAKFDEKFTKDRNRALDKMVSSKAGIPLAEARLLHLPVPVDLEEKCPQCGKKLKLRMGKNGLFVACSGYPACTFTVHIPDPDEDAIDAVELESTTCEECGSPMKLRQSRAGKAFLGCTAYPRCRNVVNVSIAQGKAEARPDEPTGETCPDCGSPLVRRHGRYGVYVSCSNYPACRYKPPKPVLATGAKCPKDGGAIVERRGRFRPFYGCVNYPACDFSLNVRPIPEACPNCGNPYLLLRERKGGPVLTCDRAGCGFEKEPGALPPMREVFLAAPAKAAKPSKPAKAAPKERIARAAPKEKPARRRAKA
ncbi:MAG TPA: type I DNA topoisomerase [Thermoanaerobaculia bacterium]|nr:type I DNA topoisomerase [Thermoanaerobaculia bacterium]